MSKVPDLSTEEKSALIMEVIAYSLTRDRIWQYDRPTTSLARLLACIYVGRGKLCNSSYFKQEMKKVPALWLKIKPYFQES